MHCGLGVLNFVGDSYLTDLYRNRSAASHMVGRITKAEHVTLSRDAFLRVVQYGQASLYAHDQMRSARAKRGTLSRVLLSLVGQWFCYGMFGILKDMDVDPVLALIAVARAAEADS